MQNYDPAQDRTPQNQLLLDQPVQYTFEPWNPPQNPMEYTMSARILASYLGIPDVAAEDATHVAGTHQATVSPPERACAEQLARSGKFLQWLRSPGSSRLLVHTNYSGGPSPVSGLSLFCVSLREALLARPDRRFIPLVFFCGLHTELLGDDSNGALVDARSGAHGLMRSLIYQLLGRYHGREPVWLNETPQEIHAIQEGNLSALYGLFHRLVHRLPGDVAVCCLVDGAVYYERDEFLDDMESVMLPLLQLCGQGVTRAPFKLLVTSPASTIYTYIIVAMASIDLSGPVSSATLTAEPDNTSVKGTTVLVTGGAQGLGAEIARKCATAGSYVTIADIDDTKGKDLASSLGANVQFINCDVRNWSDQVSAFKAAIRFAPSRGTFLARYTRPPQPRRGVFVFILSPESYATLPASVIYGGSKFGARGLFRSSRVPLVRVNALIPWLMETGMNAGSDAVSETLRSLGVQYVSVEAHARTVMHLLSNDGIAGRAVALVQSDGETFADVEDDDAGGDGIRKYWELLRGGWPGAKEGRQRMYDMMGFYDDKETWF
ncbi:putative short chain dehydrogenase reductase [Diaporthe ampelina]|uniref:Putative short chain dehydrogenase reductase n=1 Tax=Diaporthe ampelina TaxID=1214573 RepID=A0A0G2HP11_9PEZI|nr:putative short chain dehydrogenase reductase [Diaporthe ampelina]